jgi:hypothetical protein
MKLMEIEIIANYLYSAEVAGALYEDSLGSNARAPSLCALPMGSIVRIINIVPLSDRV